MKPLFDINILPNYNPQHKLPFKCKQCGIEFLIRVKRIRAIIRMRQENGETGEYCSNNCFHKNRSEIKKRIVKCKNCNKDIIIRLSEVKKNNFCSHSCNTSYNNKNRTTGYCRSKLEKWLEIKLNELYPNIIIKYNKKDDINAELDIYIPSLKLAFELNGIFHYEPIYGKEKFDKTINNDKRKFQACAENNISLCVIDTSKQKYFKENTSQEFLDIITNIINKSLTIKNE